MKKKNQSIESEVEKQTIYEYKDRDYDSLTIQEKEELAIFVLEDLYENNIFDSITTAKIKDLKNTFELLIKK